MELSYYGTPILWNSNIMELQYYGTPILWNSNIMELQYYGTGNFFGKEFKTSMTNLSSHVEYLIM
jgi:ABC-type polysaccharide/polyol phosphate export permease